MTTACRELEAGVLASVNSPGSSLTSVIFQVKQLGYGEHLHMNTSPVSEHALLPDQKCTLWSIEY